MIKNTASQIVGAQMTTAADGSDFTGAVTVYVTGNGGTQAIGSVGSGACTHEGNGYHTYAPAQAETNYDLVAFTFKGTGAVTHTVQIYTRGGDAFARLGAPVGASVSADIAAAKTVIDAIKTKVDFLPAVTAGAAGGLFIAGTNAATTITTALTANITGNITGNLSGSAGSVSGAVGSVTGNVGGNVVGNVNGNVNGNVVGSTASVVGAVGSVTGNVNGNVVGSVASVVGAVGSVTGLTVSNLDATISSRLASASYTAPDNSSITAIKAKTDNLPSDPADQSLIIAATDAVLAAVTAVDGKVDTLDTVADAVKVQTDKMTFTVTGQIDSNIQYVNDVQVIGNGEPGTEWGPV